LAGRIAELRALDSVDTCRMRLVSLRTRIETNWPAAAGRVFRRGAGLSVASETLIGDLLVALPTPLPLRAGGEPESIIRQDDSDLCAVAGRAVDAALGLLDCWSLETHYPGEVSMFESHRPVALEPIVVIEPTVGLLVATIIGTLEAISESISDTPRPAVRRVAATAPTTPLGLAGSGPKRSSTQPPPRVRRVPRI
jgi:hypothetical protein